MGIHPIPDKYLRKITQEFGTYPGGYNPVGGHTGRDYGTQSGVKVAAIAGGVVWFAGNSQNLPGGPNDWAARLYLDKYFGGNIVVIQHDDVYSIYAHNSKVHVRTGQTVVDGQHICDTGNSGGASTGPHLHFEILPRWPNYQNGTYGRVHPAPYITGKYRLNKLNKISNDKATAKAVGRKIMNGVDVSAWQPKRVLNSVPADFAIVKATEGTGYVSPHMDAQVNDALKRGMNVGLYHFATALASSDDEARHFLNATKKYRDNPRVVLVLDWEPTGLTHYTQWAEDFMRRVENTTKRVMPIYMNLSATRLNWSNFGKAHPLWLAYYGNDQAFNGYATEFHPPATPGWTLAMWQYTQHGRLKGYAGDLDLNAYFGGIQQWDDDDEWTEFFNMDQSKIDAAIDLAIERSFIKRRGSAGSWAWNIKNNRDRGFNIETHLKAIERSINGVVDRIFKRKVKRAGEKTNIDLATALAWERDNWNRDRDAHAVTQELLKQLIDALNGADDTKGTK